MKNLFLKQLVLVVIVLSTNTSIAQTNPENGSTNIPKYNYLDSFNHPTDSTNSMGNTNQTAQKIDNWKNWNLIVVTLDKNDKPNDKAEISLEKPVKLKKDNGPEIIIQNIELENSNGKIIKIQCLDNHLSQKFENPLQLKGWAFQMNCSKQNYYFIINPAFN